MRPVPRTLRDYRVARQMGLRELAELAGLNRATISQIERGRMVASQTELDAISAALGARFENRTTPVTEIA